MNLKQFCESIIKTTEFESNEHRLAKACLILQEELEKSLDPKLLRDVSCLTSYPPQNAGIWSLQIRLKEALAKAEEVLKK